jgi:hypothetical protein
MKKVLENHSHTCIICGRPLKSPRSIYYRMGAKCRQKVAQFVKDSSVSSSLTKGRIRIYPQNQRKLFERGGNADESKKGGS